MISIKVKPDYMFKMGVVNPLNNALEYTGYHYDEVKSTTGDTCKVYLIPYCGMLIGLWTGWGCPEDSDFIRTKEQLDLNDRFFDTCKAFKWNPVRLYNSCDDIIQEFIKRSFHDYLMEELK